MINVNFKLATQTASRLSLGTRQAVRMSSIATAFVELYKGLESSLACVLSPQSC